MMGNNNNNYPLQGDVGGVLPPIPRSRQSVQSLDDSLVLNNLVNGQVATRSGPDSRGGGDGGVTNSMQQPQYFQQFQNP